MLLAMITRMVTNNGHINDYRDDTSRQCCASVSSALRSIALFCLRPTSDNRAWRILSQPHRIWMPLTSWAGICQRRTRGNWNHLLLCTSLTTCWTCDFAASPESSCKRKKRTSPSLTIRDSSYKPEICSKANEGMEMWWRICLTRNENRFTEGGGTPWRTHGPQGQQRLRIYKSSPGTNKRSSREQRKLRQNTDRRYSETPTQGSKSAFQACKDLVSFFPILFLLSRWFNHLLLFVWRCIHERLILRNCLLNYTIR